MATIASSFARVIVFTARHTLLAEIDAAGRRLSDLANDGMKKHLVLQEVRITRADRFDEVVATYPRVVVKKEVLQGILIMSEPPRTAQSRLSSYVPKIPARIAVLLPAFHLVGTIHLATKTDPAVFALEGPEAFAVVSQAEVTLTARAGPPIAVPVALLNRSHIELAGAVV